MLETPNIRCRGEMSVIGIADERNFRVQRGKAVGKAEEGMKRIGMRLPIRYSAVLIGKLEYWSTDEPLGWFLS